MPPEATVTVSLISPLPLAVQVEPAEAVHVQVSPEPKLAGSVSRTCAPAAVPGPLLPTTIRYVKDWPAT